MAAAAVVLRTPRLELRPDDDEGLSELGQRASLRAGSWIGQAFQGKGIGTQMRAAVLQFAFGVAGGEPQARVPA